jgi:APA family basic amino acid/polyamine antiporter
MARLTGAGVFAAVHSRRGTPVRSIVALALVAGLFAGLGDFAGIAAVTDFAVYLVFVAVNGTVLILRRTRPKAPRPFAVRGAIGGVPVLPILGLGSVIVMMTQLEPRAIGLGLAMCTVGLAVGWLVRSRR